jgi:hypothetical protein
MKFPINRSEKKCLQSMISPPDQDSAISIFEAWHARNYNQNAVRVQVCILTTCHPFL